MLYDVIIVGGGPAGCTAGINLINKGYKVLIIDKAIFPRKKICGGGISLRTLSRFSFLPKILKEISTHYVNHAILQAPDNTIISENRDNPIYLMIDRYEFDNALLKMCRRGNINVIENGHVTRINRMQNSVEVQTSSGDRYTGKLIIGADGVNSIIAKQTDLNPGWNSEELAVVMTGECNYSHSDGTSVPVMQVFYAYRFTKGYGYIFPKEKMINIGLGFISSYYDKHVKGKFVNEFKEFVEYLEKAHCLEGTTNLGNIRSAILPTGGPLKKTYSDRVLLCGDAAGFVNAITAEGIYYAMISGELAGKAALAALANNNFSKLQLSKYQGDWQNECGKELYKSVKIQRMLFKNLDLLNFIVISEKSNAQLKRLTTDFLTGQVGYTKLKRILIFKFLPFFLKCCLKSLKVPFRRGEKYGNTAEKLINV